MFENKNVSIIGTCTFNCGELTPVHVLIIKTFFKYFSKFSESCLKTLTWAFELRFKKPKFSIQNERPSKGALSLLRSTFLQNLLRASTPLNAENNFLGPTLAQKYFFERSGKASCPLKAVGRIFQSYRLIK